MAFHDVQYRVEYGVQRCAVQGCTWRSKMFSTGSSILLAKYTHPIILTRVQDVQLCTSLMFVLPMQ